MTNQAILETACVLKGHTFVRTAIVLSSIPPQYPEVCKYCCALRTAIPQHNYRYVYPIKPKEKEA